MRLLPCVLLLLAGCQMPPPTVASAVQFQFTDLTDPDHPNATTYAAGQVVDVAPVFDAEIGLIGADRTGIRPDRVLVTSYTPECDDQPVAELYRTKLIVYPEAVTASPQLGYRLPLSTRTLMNLGLCNAQRPQTGVFRIHADLAGSPPADLLIRVNGEPPIR